MKTKKTAKVTLAFLMVLLTALSVAFNSMNSVGAAETENEELLSTSMDKTNVTTSIRGNGIRIMWNRVSGAESYTVEYFEGDFPCGRDQTWTIAESGITNSQYDKDTGRVYYAFLKAQYGKVYHFRLRTNLREHGWSISDTSNECPVFYTQKTSVYLRDMSYLNAIRVSWTSIAGAKEYRLFYRLTNEKKWSNIRTTDTYCMFNAQAGNSYAFQVFPISYVGAYGNYSDVKYSEMYPFGNSAKPNVTLKNEEDGLLISWTKADLATGYNIYFREHRNDDIWGAPLEHITKTQYKILYYGPSDYYVDKGHYYDVQVIPVYEYSENSELHNHSKVQTGMWYPNNKTDAPSYITLSNKPNGIRVEWGGVQGVDDYVVYYRIHYNDKETAPWRFYMVKGKCYYPLLLDDLDAGSKWDIQVQALPRCNGVEASYSNVQYNHYYYPDNRTAKPSLRLSNKLNGVRLEWNEIPGAACYTVYYRPKSSAYWSSVVTFRNYYPYLEAKAGTEYAFKIQAMAESNSGAASTDSDVDYITYFPAFDGTKFMDVLKDSEDDSGIIYQDYSEVSHDTDWCTPYVKYMLETKLDNRMSKALHYDSFTDNWIYNAQHVVKKNGYTPKVGDIVFLYRGATAGHVGIVTAVRGSNITYISGNTGSANPSWSRVGLATTDWHYRSPYAAGYNDPVAGYIPLSRYMK